MSWSHTSTAENRELTKERAVSTIKYSSILNESKFTNSSHTRSYLNKMSLSMWTHTVYMIHWLDPVRIYTIPPLCQGREHQWTSRQGLTLGQPIEHYLGMEKNIFYGICLIHKNFYRTYNEAHIEKMKLNFNNIKSSWLPFVLYILYSYLSMSRH